MRTRSPMVMRCLAAGTSDGACEGKNDSSLSSSLIVPRPTAMPVSVEVRVLVTEARSWGAVPA
ncbi:MAG: hypothetical protein WDO73_04875 [Ignavibacteriota bacterium]